MPLNGGREVPRSTLGYEFAKRVFDCSSALLVLILVSPVFAVITLATLIDSGWPVFFVQRRAGKDGEPFPMIKFRTMVVDAEHQLAKYVNVHNLSEPVFKLKKDPRVTRVGEVLRKTSVDELPQLINILLGHMSVVGPRPEELQVVALYSETQRVRLLVKPGLTGLMQIRGRGDLPFEDRLKLDIEYMANRTFLYDLAIIVKTVPVVLSRRGAY